MNITPSRFFCTRCGKEGIGIFRNIGRQREPGHLKKLYCIYCKDTVNHVEIKENGKYTVEDFEKEFKLGRFVNGQREQLIACSKTDCPYNVDSQCWNSNGQIHCGHKPEITNNQE